VVAGFLPFPLAFFHKVCYHTLVEEAQTIPLLFQFIIVALILLEVNDFFCDFS
jgi:hypothetical protein